MKVQETRWGGDDAVFRRLFGTRIFLRPRFNVVRIWHQISINYDRKNPLEVI
jgi:hypothetical protein